MRRGPEERKRRRESERVSEREERVRKNYVRENVIECTHISKHFCMNSFVNNCGQISNAWEIVTYLIEQVCLPCWY